jgi:hypothetical protein
MQATYLPVYRRESAQKLLDAPGSVRRRVLCRRDWAKFRPCTGKFQRQARRRFQRIAGAAIRRVAGASGGVAGFNGKWKKTIARSMLQARNLVFDDEFLALDLGNFEIVGTGMIEDLVKLIFQGPVPLFEFNEMRLHRHQHVSSICDSNIMSLLQTGRLSTRIPPHRNSRRTHLLYGL